MLKTARSLSIASLLVFFAISLGSCGSGGNNSSEPPSNEPTPQGNISQYSAGDVEDIIYNGIGIDEVDEELTSNAIKYIINQTTAVCGSMGTGYKGFFANNCTEWVAVRRCEKRDAPVIWRGDGGQWLSNAKNKGYVPWFRKALTV